jgi:hypothetical protein
MLKHLPGPMILACFFLPVFVLAAAVIGLVVLPVTQAPKYHRIALYARKYMNGRPGASEAELRKVLRNRFIPDWATRQPPEGMGCMYGLAGVLAQVLIGLRSHFALQVIEGRIDRAIEREWYDD